MTLDPDHVERVLTELADRADAHQVLDRVPAVRVRARRTARRRAGALAAALTAVIVLASGVAGFGGLPRLHGQGAGPATRPDPAGAFLTAKLVRDPAAEARAVPRYAGGRVVVIDVVLRGRVPQRAGLPAGATAQDNLWELMLYADSGTRKVTMRPFQQFTCDPGAPLVDVDTMIPVQLQYEPGVLIPVLGRHDLRFTTGACLPVGLIQAKLDVTVK